MNYILEILETRSLTIQDYLIENAPKTDPAEAKVLAALMETNDLDERAVLCHEHLGNTAEAAELREWLVKKAARKAR